MLIFCFDLAIGMNGVLKSPTIIVLLLISSFILVSICLTYCHAPMLNASIQFSSVAQLCLTLCDPMNRSTPGLLSITNSWSSLKLKSIESVMPSSHLILCRPLLLLPPIPPSIRVFSSESALCMRWPSIGVSASASVLSMNIQDWSPLGWTGWISLQSKGLSRVFSNTIVQKHQFFSTQLSSQSTPGCCSHRHL